MWIINAFLAMICMSAMILLMKHVDNMKVKPEWMLLFAFLFGGFFCFIHTRITGTPSNINGRTILWIAGIGLLSYLANLFCVNSLSAAPNPGYTTAILGMNAVIVSVAAIYLFDGDFSWTKGAGILLCAAGVTVISI